MQARNVLAENSMGGGGIPVAYRSHTAILKMFRIIRLI